MRFTITEKARYKREEREIVRFKELESEMRKA